MEPKICQHCGEEYFKKNKKYCCKECSDKHQSERSINNWKCPTFREKLTKKLKEAANKPDTKTKKSKATQASWEDPIIREKRILNMEETNKDPIVKSRRSEARKLLWQTPEFKENQRIARGELHADPIRHENQQRGLKNLISNPELKKQRIETVKKTYNDHPELREEKSKQSTEMWEDPEYREKRHASLIKALSTPEARQVKSDVMIEVCKRPEIKKAKSNAMKNNWDNPEYRRNLVEKRLEMWADPLFYLRNFSLWYGAVTYSDDPYCELWTPELRERVRGSYGYICPLCGTPQNGKRLHVHHVLWNKKTCCDHDKRYLLPLCHSCHSLVKGNKAKTRKMWIEELTIMIEGYYEGKSFLTKEEWNTIKNAPFIPLETRYIIQTTEPISF